MAALLALTFRTLPRGFEGGVIVTTPVVQGAEALS